MAASQETMRPVLQREAILNGDWQPYQAALRHMGAGYAQSKVPFQDWIARTTAFRKIMGRGLMLAYADDPRRLAQALLAQDLLLDWSQTMIGQGYLGVREQMSHSQQEALYDSAGVRQSERKFRGLLESAPDGLVIVDSQGRMVLVNGQTEKLFGYARSELLGNPVEMLVPERFHPEHPGHRMGYFAAPHPRPMGVGLALFGRRRDGTEFPVEISLSPLEADEGRLVTATIRDITERRQTEEALRRSEERASVLLDSIHDYAISRLDPHGQVVSWNAGAQRPKGWRAAWRC